MALQVWLPLNGNLNNQGLKNVIATNSGAAIDSGGKIGKCYYLSGSTSSYINTSYGTNIGTSDFSIAMWVKIPTITSGNYYAVCTSKTAAAASSGFGIYWNYSQKRFLWSTANGSTSNEIWMSSTVDTLVYDKWIHLVMVRNSNDPKIGYFYINGVRYDLASTPTVLNITSGTKLILGKTSDNYYPIKAYYNDFRIYDHALSIKEVKELSKGLVLHYTMNDNGLGNENIITNALQIENSTGNFWTGRDYSNTTLSGKTAVISATGPFDLYRWMHSIISVSMSTFLTPGQTWTFSCDVRGTVSGTINIWMNVRSSNSDVASPNLVNNGTNTIPTEWTRYWVSITPRSEDSARTLLLCGFSGTANGTGTLYFKNMKLEKGGIHTSWCPAKSEIGADSTVVYDCSGYGYDGTITGSLAVESDTPRHQASTVFNGSSCINAGRGAMIRDAISVCCWGYMTSWSSYDARLMSCTEGGGWNFEPASGKMNFACGTGASSNVYKSATGATALSALTSGWHQFVGTYDGFNTKIYIDGVLDGTNAAYTTKTPLFYNSSNAIFVGAEAGSSASSPVGSYFKGRLSDVRIYATALSADDIKELYNTSTFIANNGTIGSYEFVEESSSPQIFKSGVFKSTNISEYSDNLKILSDGSTWIRLMHHNNPASNLFTTDNCWNNSATNLYSRLGLLKTTAWASSSGEYEFLVYEKATSSSSEVVYRWKQTSNPATSSTLSGYQLISGSPPRSCGLMNKNTYGCFHNGGTWWCCCGSYTAYQGGIPGFSGIVTTGYIDFYVRVPDVKMINEDKAILHSDNIQSKQIIEI